MSRDATDPAHVPGIQARASGLSETEVNILVVAFDMTY